MAIEALKRISAIIEMNSKALNHSPQELSQKKNEKLWKKNSYKCEKCRDTGWIISSKENMADSADSCECREKEILKALWLKSGINIEDSNKTFGSFKVFSASSQRAKDTAMAYYRDFDNIRNSEENSIMLCGQVGSGKSHLSQALAINFLKRNVKIVYMNYRDFMPEAKLNRLNREYFEKTIGLYKNCEVLLIDDLFKGNTNETDIDIMYEIIDYRTRSRLPIIVTSELTVKAILRLDEGLGSRIQKLCKSYTVEIEKSLENNYRIK